MGHEQNWISGARRIEIITGLRQTPPESKAVEILRNRILKRSSIEITVTDEGGGLPGDEQISFVVGSPRNCDLASRLLRDLQARLPCLPDSAKCHPEGFAVKTGISGARRYVLVAGADERAVIYGVGHVLRAITYHPDSIDIPSIDVQERPAFRIRGGRPTGPGIRARKYGRLREQTEEERREVMEDIMLLGTNVFGGRPETANSYKMLTIFRRTANAMPGGFPKEWGADRDMSMGYVCPSVPEARKSLLDHFDRMFREAPDYDYFTTNSGDNGGCRCERCMPWGRTYIELAREIAGLLHKHHPNCKVLATNQDLTNEGNEAILDYLNNEDPGWLFALHYGPGADEMQTYIRGPVNPRWFEYEGFGPLGNYLKHMHHELPRETNIVLFSDITHWIQSQYGIPKPDVALAAVHGRRSWNARPSYLHRIAMEIFHYALGDIHYSEGMHDDFNKWLWYRLLWDPHLSAEEITEEYCRYWFGPDAARDAASAIFLMERVLVEPVIDNPRIRQAVEKLRIAGDRIPGNLRRLDYRWHIMMQRALMDQYIQLELRRGRELKRQALALLNRIPASNERSDLARKALEILERPPITADMKSMKEEAISLGESSNRSIGYRIPAPFIVDELDLTEIRWWAKTLREALSSGDDSRIQNAAAMLRDYENPGEGGYYDNLGWPNESGHLVQGETLWGFLPFSGPAKLSQFSMAYCWEKKDFKIALDYEGLDPVADYTMRVCLGFHGEKTIGRIPQRMVSMMQESGGVRLRLALNDHLLEEEIEVPDAGPRFYEFDLPQDETRTGSIEICFTPESRLPVVGPSEIWVMRKDKVVWHS